MKRALLTVLALLGVADRAEAKCTLPKLELIWSYPAAGEADVPTNAELWVLVPSTWWNPVVRLDGQELSYEAPLGSRGLVHLLPGALLANHDYVLQLDFSAVQPDADAGASRVIEISFHTGASSASKPAAPALGPYQSYESQAFEVAPGGYCGDVFRAQACIDYGPLRLHTFPDAGPTPLAWLVGEHIIPARCGLPQLITQFHQRAAQCLDVRAIGAAGLISDAVSVCIPERTEERVASPDAALPSPAGEVDEVAMARTHDDGCRLAPRGGFGWLLMATALARAARRRRA